MLTFLSLVFRLTSGTLNKKDESQISKYRNHFFFHRPKAGGDVHNSRMAKIKNSVHVFFLTYNHFMLYFCFGITSKCYVYNLQKKKITYKSLHLILFLEHTFDYSLFFFVSKRDCFLKAFICSKTIL